MYGEDSSGRKVSLLNDDSPPPPPPASRTSSYSSSSSSSSFTAAAAVAAATTTNTTNVTTTVTASSSSSTTTSSSAPLSNITFPRPRLPDRSRFSNSDSSVCSSRSRDSYRSSRPSSVSCSPRRTTPPTPPLVRLDSTSSTSTIASPMTPSYQYDPMDLRHVYKNPPSAQPGFYVNNYPAGHAAGGSPYPPMPDAASQSMYPMSGHQTLHSVYDLNDSFAHQASIHSVQAASLPQFSPSAALNSLSPTQNASLLPSPSTMMPTPLNTKPSNPHRDSTASSSSSTNRSSYPASSMSPIKTDPSTPITSSSSNTKSGNNNATQPKKKYPCPHAKQAGCKDTFTTSGHAARHGKKHTGEKNVACPTCGKTFTRKDNMKQHERTHKSSQAANANANRSSSNSINASPVLTSSSMNKRARSSTMGSSPGAKELEGGDLAMMDMTLDAHLLHAATSRPEMRRSKLSEILEQVRHDGEMDAEGELDADADGESPALDALATVAAGEMVQ